MEPGRPILNQAEGDSVGTVVQVGAVHGPVHIHGGGPGPEEIPRQLGPAPAGFVGRAAELAALHQARAATGATVFVLSGPAGVGKTALARRFAQDLRPEFPRGQLHVDLNGFSESDPVDPGEALGHFLRSLGLAAARIPGSLAEQAALYRTATADRPLLVILDNAFSPAQARVLIPAGPGSVVVVTSRRQLAGLVADGATFLDVGPLGVDASVELLGRAAGAERIESERRDAEAVATMCAGLPIALTVAAGRLATRPHLTVSRLADELRAETSRLHGLRTADELSVPGSFDLSYRGLSPALAALYRRLSAHAGHEFGLGPVRAVLSSIGGPLADEGAATAVDHLVEGSLLHEVSANRFRFHDLLLLHARHKLSTDETPVDRAAIHRLLLEWYLGAARGADRIITPYRRPRPYAVPENLPFFADREDALGWLERERVNLIAAAQAALAGGLAELAWHLTDAMWGLLLYRKHYRDRRGLDELGVEAARRWGDRPAEAVMLMRLGRACTISGDYADAEHHLRLSISCWGDDLPGATDAREFLAALYRDCGRTREAVAVFEEVLATARGLGDDRRTGRTLISLGSLLATTDRPAEAIALLRQARPIFARLGDVDPYNSVRVDVGLAVAYLAMGDTDTALALAIRGEEGMRKLGSPYEQAHALEILAAVADRRGEHDVARQHRSAALAIHEALGSPLGTRPVAPGTTDPAAVEGHGDVLP